MLYDSISNFHTKGLYKLSLDKAITSGKEHRKAYCRIKNMYLLAEIMEAALIAEKIVCTIGFCKNPERIWL